MSIHRIRILLVDDQKLIRQSVTALLTAEPDMEVVGEATGGRQAIELTQRLMPEVVIMDINMPNMDGIQATRAIHSEFPDINVIGFSLLEESVYRDAMKHAGAVRNVDKTGPSEELISAIRGCPRRPTLAARGIAPGESARIS